MRHYSLILLFLIATQISCQDKKNIIVTGRISDEISGEPIPNAEVVILCWYSQSIDNASFKKQTVRTDQDGNYKVNFDKGHQIDVASKMAGYNPNRSYNELSDRVIKVNLKLSRIIDNPTLISIHSTDELIRVPFMRIRIYSAENGKDLDFDKSETYGFDFKSMTTTLDTSQCDLWFKIERREGEPSTINTNRTGGIIAIFENEVKSSLLYEKSIAPKSGYVTEHKLNGNEIGFFVLCRDGRTYGKVILETSIIEISSPDGKGGYFKEFGKNLSCLYQPNGTSNLTYPNNNVDLEDFLVDYRLK